jgi:hypothetical protein
MPMARKVKFIDVFATGGRAFLAGTATATGQKRENNVIAWGNFYYVSSNGFDDTGPFVAKHNRVRHCVDLVTCHHVRVAHACCDNADQNFVRPRRPKGHIFELEWAAFLANHCSLDLPGR